MMRLNVMVAILLVTCGSARSEPAHDDIGDAINVILSAEPDGSNASLVRRSADRLTVGGSQQMLRVLEGMKGASPLAENWLRNCFEQMASQALMSDRGLPGPQLLEFIRDTEQSPAARRVAYEWLLQDSPALQEELIPNMLQDPSPEFRRDAVAQVLSQARKATADQSVELYRKALSGAVHEDQVKDIAAALSAHGQNVDIRKHFGFLPVWKTIGPFDNRDKKGYPVAYPPESEIDFDAEYAGQLGKVKWQPLTTDDEFGIVDIAESIENYKGSVMYAATTFDTDRERTVQFRLGTPNAWKLWLNGTLIFEREEYHRSSGMDQYRMPVTLKPGANTILLKICQNEQEDDWAQRYQFQIRVCTSTGTAVLPSGSDSANATPISSGASAGAGE